MQHSSCHELTNGANLEPKRKRIPPFCFRFFVISSEIELLRPDLMNHVGMVEVEQNRREFVLVQSQLRFLFK